MPTDPRPRTIVLGASDRPRVVAEAERLRQDIEQHCDIVVWDMGFEEDLDEKEADLVIVFGGDGSILRSAHKLAGRPLPVVGVNMGKLGFLADLTPDELIDSLPDICQQRCRVIEHLMYDAEVYRGDAVINRHLGLNEVAVLAGPPFQMLEVHLYVDAKLATTYSCDGLIVSTPVGSTAHSLSAGGPILRKDLQAFVICPISPHTLTNRPVVDTADRTYELVVTNPNAGSGVVADGRWLTALEPNDRVRVRRAAATFRMVEAPGHSYYRTLREKLGWGGRLRLAGD
ncbi:MAG: NAD(+)/NADH kinase [Planctomycetales bacterium]|nr:NAD(+)/NADH kinase [Planctomycetales bacterium]